MKEEHFYKTGIYLAYPTSSEPISIFRQKKYKTEVNNMHTKIGIAKKSFIARKNGYSDNFYGNVKFTPVAIIEDIEELKECERLILKVLNAEFKKVNPSREWFETNDHQKVIDIVVQTLSLHKINYILTNHNCF